MANFTQPAPPDAPSAPSANPSRGDEVNEGKVERGELVMGWGSTEMMILEWKVLRIQKEKRVL